MYAAVAFDIQRHVRRMPVAGHVLKTHLAGLIQTRGDDADRRFDAVLARPDPAHCRERDHQADRAVPAHVQTADVVEEDDAGRAARIARRNQQRADHDIRPAGFVDDGRSEPVELVAETARDVPRRVPSPKSGPPATTTRVGSPPVWESMTWMRWICSSDMA